jgi:hypothetical protein
MFEAFEYNALPARIQCVRHHELVRLTDSMAAKSFASWSAILVLEVQGFDFDLILILIGVHFDRHAGRGLTETPISKVKYCAC